MNMLAVSTGQTPHVLVEFLGNSEDQTGICRFVRHS